MAAFDVEGVVGRKNVSREHVARHGKSIVVVGNIGVKISCVVKKRIESMECRVKQDRDCPITMS